MLALFAYAGGFSMPSFALTMLIARFSRSLKWAFLAGSITPALSVALIAFYFDAINSQHDGSIGTLGAIGAAMILVGGIAGRFLARRVYTNLLGPK